MNSIMKQEKICPLIEKYDYISFDLFDTLIYRCVSTPHRIFELIDEEGKIELKNLAIKNFYEMRIDSEVVAQKGKDAISIDKIYELISKRETESVALFYKEKEIEYENTFSVCNERLKKIYDFCLLKQKKIIITTDMYLSNGTIVDILNKNGYIKYDKLYVSGSIGCSKRNGTIFDYIVNDLNIEPNKILHIGDSVIKDYVMPKKNKWNAILFRNQLKKHRYRNNTEDVLKSFLVYSDIKNEMDYKIGYEYFGPLLFGYTKWLHDSFEKDEMEIVLFMSRDGYLMKKAYDLMYPKDREGFYFNVSRRLLLGATIWMHSELSELKKRMYLPKKFTIKTFLKTIGVSTENYFGELEEYNIDLDEILDKDTFLNNARFSEFYAAIRNDVIKKSKIEYIALVKQIKSLFTRGRVAIVDIGWNGNMQKCLEEILDQEKMGIKVNGYYLGVNPYSINNKSCNMKGYLYDKNKNLKNYEEMRFAESVLELFFMAPHGSAEKYRLIDSGEVVLDRKKFEYENTETFFMIENIQKAALEFIKYFKEKGMKINNEMEVYSDLFMKRFLIPDIKLVKYLKKIKIFDGKWYDLIEKESYLSCIFHPSKFIHSFENSSWKPGFLKDVFRIHLPYDEILAFVYRMYNNNSKKNQR